MSNMHQELHHLPAPDEARTLGRVGIVGASPTAVAIVRQLLDADVPVTLYEPDGAVLGAALAQIRAAWSGPRDRRLALLAGTINFHHLKDADLLIDATETDGREQLFHRLDQTAKHGALMATTAARAGIDALARRTRRPREVFGLHIAQQGWELVPGKETSGAARATVLGLARRLHGPAASPVPAAVAA